MPQTARLQRRTHHGITVGAGSQGVQDAIGSIQPVPWSARFTSVTGSGKHSLPPRSLRRLPMGPRFGPGPLRPYKRRGPTAPLPRRPSERASSESERHADSQGGCPNAAVSALARWTRPSGAGRARAFVPRWPLETCPLVGERGLFAPALLVARPALTGFVPQPSHLIFGTSSYESRSSAPMRRSSRSSLLSEIRSQSSRTRSRRCWVANHSAAAT